MTGNQLIDQLTSENTILNFEPQVFWPDNVAKIRSELSITVLEKKMKTADRVKKRDLILLKFVKISLLIPKKRPHTD